jgi:hypothetical protein
VNVWMENFCHKLNLRRRDGVILFNLEVELEPTFLIRGIWWPLNIAMPMKEVVIDRCQDYVLVLRPSDLHELLIESISRNHYLSLV